MKFKRIEKLECEDTDCWLIVPDANLVGGVHAWILCPKHSTITRIEVIEE